MAILESLSGSQASDKFGGSFLSYPEQLGTLQRHNHYVMFFINVPTEGSAITYGSGAYNSASVAGAVRNDPGTLSIKRAETKQLAQAIALYMPAKISVGHKANYGEAEIGAAVAAFQAGKKTFTPEGVDTSNATQEAKNFFSGLVDEVATGAKAATEIASGKITNNRTEMKFEGVNRRDFQFEFTMLPTNAKEAATVEQIVNTFRFHSMPEISGALQSSRTMISPSTFDIEYKPNKHLHRIATSVLESVEVQYGGERPQFFTDDQPVQTSLTLSFKELGIITKQQIKDGF